MLIKELLIDLYGCKSNLDDIKFLETVLKDAAQKMGSEIVKVILHKFKPTGSTVILILAETHMSIHTWPEHNYAAVDIFICSESIIPETGWQVIKEALKPSSFKINKITRQVE